MASFRNRRGFTLAEVLVTLLVIGIVASLTIPQLIQSTGRNENKVALKKAIGVLNNALALNMFDGLEANDPSIGSAIDLATYFGRKITVISGAGTNDIYAADGTEYIFTRTGSCGTADTDFATATCSVVVDVNGARSPNTLSSGNSAATYVFKDRYNLVVRNNAVLPSSSATNTVAVAAVSNQ